ncbi:hypothetical protein TSAR_006298, partial [Trichomalopsis sarcophagae]
MPIVLQRRRSATSRIGLELAAYRSRRRTPRHTADNGAPAARRTRDNDDVDGLSKLDWEGKKLVFVRLAIRIDTYGGMRWVLASDWKYTSIIYVSDSTIDEFRNGKHSLGVLAPLLAFRENDLLRFCGEFWVNVTKRGSSQDPVRERYRQIGWGYQQQQQQRQNKRSLFLERE